MQKQKKIWSGVFGLLLALSCTTCSVDEDSNDGYYDEPNFDGSVDGGNEGPQYPDDNVDYESFLLSRPVASRSFVFIANRTRGTLAKVAVNGNAIQIDTVRVGGNPTIVRTIHEEDIAVVLNEGFDTVAVVEAAPIGGQDIVHSLEVLPGCNQLSLAPNGRVVFAYYNHARAETGDELGAFSEISAVVLDEENEPEVYQITVGMNIRDIQYNSDGETAYVVTDSGIGILQINEINGDGFVVSIALDPPGQAAPVGSSREVFVTDDGQFAMLRDGSSETLRVVELATGSIVEVVLPAAPTDLDLIPDSENALITISETNQIGLVDLSAMIQEETLPEEAIEWFSFDILVRYTVVSPDGRRVVVVGQSDDIFGPTEVVIFNIDERLTTRVELRKGVQATLISPDGRNAVIFHNKDAGIPQANAPIDEVTAKSYAITILNLISGEHKYVGLDAFPTEIAFTETGDNAFVLSVSESNHVYDMHQINLQTLGTDRFSFDQLPEHIGVIDSANVAYISQEHDLGRIAFVDIQSGEVREITGFELNGLIE